MGVQEAIGEYVRDILDSAGIRFTCNIDLTNPHNESSDSCSDSGLNGTRHLWIIIKDFDCKMSYYENDDFISIANLFRFDIIKFCDPMFGELVIKFIKAS